MIVVGVVALVILAGGAFFAGMAVGEARANNVRRQFAQARFGTRADGSAAPVQAPQGGQVVARPGGGTLGTIESIAGDTLTVSTQEGKVQVKTTETTLIQKYTAVDVADLEPGEQVMVMGARNDDGSITARSVQALRMPQMPWAGQAEGE